MKGSGRTEKKWIEKDTAMSNLIERYLEQKQQIGSMQQEIERLKKESRWFQEENDRITHEPYYIKAMKFRADVKKTFFYKIYCWLRYGLFPEDLPGGAMERYGEPQRQEAENAKTVLYPDEYRFLKYKQRRNRGFQIHPAQIQTAYQKGLVSVVLPVFNGEDYLALSVESVLNQTYEQLELIIIDDGSTDRTAQIADGYAKEDARVRVIHQENRKLPKSLSRGFRHARGEFFTWTSADNMMHAQMLEKFVRDMKTYQQTGMLFGNLKLIDENGRPKTDFPWYAHDQEHLEHVIFQKNMLELNTYPNNYIGASFLYRSVVANVVEDYSAYKYGIEDYDYWMKVNELFTLRHVSFEEPEYSYRMHENSLTAKDKELKITENRYQQMLLDDFRRDYYLKQQMWIVETADENSEAYRSLLRCIERFGQRRVTIQEARMQTRNLYDRFIYVKFTQDTAACDAQEDWYKVLIAQQPQKVKGESCWDCYISLSAITEQDFIAAYQGWFGIAQGEEIFAFVDSKARNTFLYAIEGYGATFTADEKKVSVVVSYSGNKQQLDRCLESVRSDDPDAEILVAGPASQVTRLSLPKGCMAVACLSDNDITRKNIAAGMACGTSIFFLQDDCIVEKGYFHQMQQLFSMHQKVAAVYGNVEVVTRKRHAAFLKWMGEYAAEQDDVYQYQCGNVPSAYSFAIANQIYKIMGGFYHCGCYENEFCGMEYMGAANRLGRAGYYTMLSAQSHVVRYVDEIGTQKVRHIWKNFLYARYQLETETALPQEDHTDELNTVEKYGCGLEKIREELCGQMQQDRFEKEKVELNRDIFSRLV